MQDDSEESATAAAAVSGEPVYSERGSPPSPAQRHSDGEQADDAGERFAGQGQDDREQARGTGEPRVDQAIARLDGLAGLPPDEHVAVFEDIHGKLRQVLSELDSGPADSGAAGR
jgi:hypothetical protein